jgi:DNA-binding MarR family transcriptional regulator
MNKMTSQLQQASSLLYELSRADHLFSTRLEAALDANGLSIAKFGVLKELVQATEPIPLGQLAERLTCVKSNITQLIDRLEADGFVRRLPDSEDRRSKRAAITEEGRRHYEIGKKVALEVEQELLHNLSPEEQELVALVLGKLSSVRA